MSRRVVAAEQRQDRLVDALLEVGDDVAVNLADRLVRCREAREIVRAWGGRPDHPDLRAVLGSGRHRCRHHACWSCRPSLILARARKEAQRFHDADGRWCSHITVSDSIVCDLAKVRDRVEAISRSLRNARDAMARQSPWWRRVEVIGHAEIDAYNPQEITYLAPDQASLLPALPGYGPVLGSGNLWVLRLHLVVRHENVSREELKAMFGRIWPAVDDDDLDDERRVLVQEFEDGLPVENAGALLSYGIKQSTKMNVGGHTSPWPYSWQATYWRWLHSLGRGLQPLRVAVGPMGSKQPAPARTALSSEWDLPMPVSLGW